MFLNRTDRLADERSEGALPKGGKRLWDIFSLGGVILDLLQTVVDFWNDKVSLVFELLGQSPVSFKNGGPWAVVANLEPIFVAVGSSLVVTVL